MSIADLIKRNLSYYWEKNLFLALGIAVSAAVITGALIVGDSVQYSLNRIVDNRLGNVSHVLNAGDRYFTAGLAGKVSSATGFPSAPVLLLQGIATSEGGQKRINHAKIIGIDSTFGDVTGFPEFFSGLNDSEVIISRNMATGLNVVTGDEILLRIEKASLIPLNAPFVSDANNIASIRVIIKKIADENHLGSFNLQISQTAPYNVFISNVVLNRIMDLDERANTLLFTGAGESGGEELMRAIRDNWHIADAGLKITVLDELNMLEVTSQRVFIDDLISEKRDNDPGYSYPVITYFVNTIESGNKRTPYSFVSSLPDSWIRRDEIIINEWLAEDLGASEGDRIRLNYYIVGPLRELVEDSAMFVIKRIVPVNGRFADKSLMPDIPGLSDAGNCRDWETGIPVDLELIRDKDEEYWNRWKGTPKAFIAVSRASGLWQNRFGTFTSLRYDAFETDAKEIETAVLSSLSPEDIGFSIDPVRSRGYVAAKNGVDFSQLFAGLSFFLIVAGILLSALLFILNLESRQEQLQTLSSMGITNRLIRRSVIMEGMIIALAGSLLGLLLAILYNRLVFLALNSIWRDIVRTEMMRINIQPSALASGMVISLAVSWFVLYVPLNRFLRKRIRIHHRPSEKKQLRWSPRFLFALSMLSGLAGIILIIHQLSIGDVVNPSIFFTAGSLFLIAFMLLSSFFIRQKNAQSGNFLRFNQLSRRNAFRNHSRSLSIIILFAIGTFLVISTGSNRKDLFRNAGEPSSGTGGFLFYAESTVPFLRNLNNSDVRIDFGLEGDYPIIQLRKAPGDDASCLNLNRIANPQILGVDPAGLEGRFSFITETEYLDKDSPWLSLDRELPGGLIPAVADETVIKWGLGLKVGDTLTYTNAGGEVMKLLLTGGLAPSIFQGSVIISERHFMENFPHSSGTEVFLVDGHMADTAVIRSELISGLRDYGWEMTLSARRLTEFNSVTNTYLSIFLVMGALGLLVGTIGLAVVLVRTILERRREIAVLRAMGFSRRKIRQLIFREYMMLLTIGVGAGFASAVIATLPSFISPNSDISFSSILWILLLLILNGWIWIFSITRNTLGSLSVNEALRND